MFQRPFAETPGTAQIISDLSLSANMNKDLKLWNLTMNGAFTVKSFYCFLDEGGLRCPIAKFFFERPMSEEGQYF